MVTLSFLLKVLGVLCWPLFFFKAMNGYLNIDRDFDREIELQNYVQTSRGDLVKATIRGDFYIDSTALYLEYLLHCLLGEEDGSGAVRLADDLLYRNAVASLRDGEDSRLPVRFHDPRIRIVNLWAVRMELWTSPDNQAAG